MRGKSSVLLYPALDIDQAMPSVEELGGGEFYVHASDYAYCWDQWVPEEHRSHPYATPYTNADLSGVAPALVATAAYDPLRDEGEEYGSRLWRAGGDRGRTWVVRM